MDHKLIAIGERSRDALLDVVFVHGLTGGPFTTWNGDQDDCEKADEVCMGAHFWPRSLKGLLDEKFGAQAPNIWTLGYPAPLRASSDPYAYRESIMTAIRPCVRKLVHCEIGTGTNRGVVFVAHSLGGLVVKAVLAHCGTSNDSAERRILIATHGVAFLGTPHSGSALATLLGNLPTLLEGVGGTVKIASWLAGTPGIGTAVQWATKFTGWFAESSNQVNWLDKAGADLRALAETYRDLALKHGISTRAYYETQPLKHLAPKNLLWIVDASNADPGVTSCRPIPIPGCDHVEICKPLPPRIFINNDIMHWLAQLVEEQRRGKDFPVLHEEISAICQAIIHDNRERFEQVLTPLPRRLEDIPAEDDLRADFSHKFKSEAASRLRQELGERLSSSRNLQDALDGSPWALDQLVLFLWHGQRLRNVLENYLKALKDRTGWIERTRDSPSLIPTYRLIDSLREALAEGLPPLLQHMEDTRKWIDDRAKTDPKLDEKKATRHLLEWGNVALKPAVEWKKP